MIPSRGALRSLPRQTAARRLPVPNPLSRHRGETLASARRQLSTAATARLLPASQCPRSPSFDRRPVAAASALGVRSLSLWPFRSSKPAAPSATETPPPSTPETPAPEAAAASTAQAAPEQTTAATSAPTPSTPDPVVAATTTTTSPLDTNPEVAAILSETLSGTGPTAPVLVDGVYDPTASLLDMPEHIGYLATLGIDFGWGPSSTMAWVLEHVHVYSGFPWWASIIATAALIRVVTAPLAVKQSEAMRRMTVLSANPAYKDLQSRMMLAMKDKTALTEQRMLFQTMREMAGNMKKEAGVKLRDMWLPMLIQAPLGFAMWRLLRTMADIPVPGLETGGVLWFSDLAAADPFYILPLVNPALVWFMNKANSAFQTPQQVAQGKRMFMFMGPVSVAFTLWLPAGLQLYFISTFGLGALQTYMLRNAVVRNALGLPPWIPPNYADNPAAAMNATNLTKTAPAPSTDLVYMPPRTPGAGATVAVTPAATNPTTATTTDAAAGAEAPKNVTERVVKAINDSVPWQLKSTPQDKEREAREKKLKEDDEAERRLEQLQRERRRRDFEKRFS